jgi:acetyltransferase-like isoleucine patch superfamily enzyme
MTRLGTGLYLQEAVQLQAEVEIGDNTSIHMGAVIGHESKIGQSVFIAHAVSVSGCCSVGDGTFVGTNATILPRTKIGCWATIGAGCVVTKDVPDYAVVVGNPGKVIRTNEPPDTSPDAPLQSTQP